MAHASPRRLRAYNREKKAEEESRRRSEGQRKLAAWLPGDVVEALGNEACARNTTMGALVEKALRRMLRVPA